MPEDMLECMLDVKSRAKGEKMTRRPYNTMAALCFATTFANSAYAENLSLPLYEVDGPCGKSADEWARMYGDREMALKQCVSAEQKAYDQLKTIWEQILPVTKNRCLSPGPPKSAVQYQVLKGCVDSYWTIDRDAAERADRVDKFKP
jgi:hypothetical protein